MARLEVDIKKSYPSFTLNVSFTAGDETVGILGASGCGKSQTLRAIAGIMKPDEGRIVLNGQVLFDSARKINVPPRKRNVSYLFQNYQLFPTMTVEQNIMAGMKRTLSKDQQRARKSELVSFFKLDGLEETYATRLSGGQQQRVALARLLASDPALIMLDEPFSALDSSLKAEIYPDLVESLRSFDGPRLYVSHDIDESFLFCDRMFVLDKGRITDEGSAERVVAQPQSLASMRLSGFHNISAYEQVDDTMVYAQDWGVHLKVAKPVPGERGFIGIRDNAIDIVVGPSTNTVYAKVMMTNLGIYRREASVAVLHEIDQSLSLEDVLSQGSHLTSAHGSRLLRVSRSVAAREAELVIDKIVRIRIPEEALHMVVAD